MPRHFDFGGGNRREEQNDNRGQNGEAESDKDKTPGMDDFYEGLVRGDIPADVAGWLSEQSEEIRNRFREFFNQAQSGFPPGTPTGEDLEFINFVLRASQEEASLEEEVLTIQAYEDTRQGMEEEAMRRGIVLMGEVSDEELAEMIQENRQRLREARQAREAREQEERLYPETDTGPDGRKRTIRCQRKIGDQTLDPIARFYKLTSVYNSPQDNTFDRQPASSQGRLALNKHDADTYRSLAAREFKTNERSIATTKVDWSLGGYTEDASLVPANASTFSEQIYERWNDCFTGEGEPVELSNATLEAHRQIANDNPTNPKLLFTNLAGGDFGQSQAFNFAARMNTLAADASPDPRQGMTEEQLIESLNASFSVPAEGVALSSTQVKRMTDLLSVVNWDGNINSFLRLDDVRITNRGAGPATGYEFYRAIIRHFRIRPNTSQEAKLMMAGISNAEAKAASEGNFVSYEYYNFKAYSGLARDLFGHQASKTEGDLNSDVFGYINPEYNYFYPEYENAIAGSNVPHLLLPNFYTYILASSDNLPDGENPEFLGGERHSTLKTQAIQQITLNEFSDNLLPSLRGDGLTDYLTQYSESVQGGLTTNLSSQLMNLYRNTGIPADQIDIFDRLNSRSSTFPMTIKIGVPTGPIGPIGAMIERTGTSTSMMNLLVNSTGQSELFNFTCNAYEMPVLSDDPFDIEIPENHPEASDLKIETSTVVYDFDDWILNIEDTSDELAMLVTNQDGNGERLPDELATLSVGHYTDNLKLAVEAKAQAQTMTYENLMSRELELNACASETFMYKLRKFTTEIDGENPRLINEFYFPNTQLSKIIEYVDTQVKYNETYYYELFGYNIVFGSEFRFRTRGYNASGGSWSQDTFNTRPLHYSFNVETLPNIKVVEYPIFGDTWRSGNLSGQGSSPGGVKYPIARIVDRPPLPPEVFPVPLKDNFSQVMFNIQQPQVGRYIHKYISLSTADEEQFRQISRTQKIQENYDLKRGEIEFMNEGAKVQNEASLQEIKSIEVYRTEELVESPTSEQEVYSSFRDKLHKVIPSNLGLDFLDTLEPNKTYYYTFRALDRHDKFSNPSQIYEINLSYVTGDFVPNIRIYNPEDDLIKLKSPSKKMTRFIEIKAADIQSQVYDERSEGNELIRSRKGLVEDQENKVTTNKFLIRLTSKDSGKKINFLIDFKER